MIRFATEMRLSRANAVTAIRPLVTLPLIACIVDPVGFAGSLAAILFAAAAISDFADGRIARKHGEASNVGRWLDHLCDISFLLPILVAFVAIGIAPWWVPASIAAAFSFYVADSLRRPAAIPAPALRGSRIGHWGGISNYVLVGTLIGNYTVGLAWIPNGLISIYCLLVPVYSLAAVVDRLRVLPPPVSRERSSGRG